MYDPCVKVRYYDYDGDIVKEVSVLYENNKKNKNSYVITYDQEGRVLSKIFSENPKNDYSYTVSYDEHGLIKSVIHGENPKHWLSRVG